MSDRLLPDCGFVEHDRRVDEASGLPMWVMRLA